MLTPHTKDPNREEQLKVRKEKPQLWGPGGAGKASNAKAQTAAKKESK